MLNISDVTGYYIEHKFINERKQLILDAFSLMEEFQMKFYEDRYINLINSYEVLSNDDIYTTFNNFIVEDILKIINAHGVSVDSDSDVSLSELLEVSHALLLLANLEDYDFVSYRVNTQQTSKATFIDLLERYTLLSRVRSMEIISEVKESLIETLRALSERSEINSDEDIDLKHFKYVNRFFKYIGDTPCMASNLKEKGFDINLSIEELVNLQTFDLVDYFHNLATTNLAQVALDIFSLLVYTRDEYNLPVFKYKKYANLFVADSNLNMRIHNALFSMVNDFSVFLTACEEEDKVNAN